MLQEILDIVWPQTFITNPQLQEVLNTQFVTSADQTSTSPQTIVYTINPKAVWSDGKPIDGADFVYNYDAQSGKAAYKDVGGKPFDDATTVGYNQMSSVTAIQPAERCGLHDGSPRRRSSASALAATATP